VLLRVQSSNCTDAVAAAAAGSKLGDEEDGEYRTSDSVILFCSVIIRYRGDGGVWGEPVNSTLVVADSVAVV